MAAKRMVSKNPSLFKTLLIIEGIMCYMAVLTVLSFWRGPANYEALTDIPLLKVSDFTSFADEPVLAGETLRFENDHTGTAVGYTAELRLQNLERVAVSFALDCPEEVSGSILHIDFFADGYDSDEQEFKLELSAGHNEAGFSLTPGAAAPEYAQMRFFTLDLADYDIQHVEIYEEKPLPKVTGALWAGLIGCFLLLLITFIFYLSGKQGRNKNLKGEFAVIGPIKKIIRRLIAWYVDPVYQQNAELREKLEKSQSDLSEYYQQLVGQESQLTDCLEEIRRREDQLAGCLEKMRSQEEQFTLCLAEVHEQEELLVDCQARIDRQNDEIRDCNTRLVDLSRSILSWNELVQQLQSRDRVDAKQAIQISDYIDSEQAAIIYAYRYLLNREPEDKKIVIGNERDWHQLREEFQESDEYKLGHLDRTYSHDMPYHSVDVAGITYFFDRQDTVIPNSMIVSGKNWAEDDIKNFLKIADSFGYRDIPPAQGVFLDIGGNIGTTSIFCKKKLKPELQYIGFEPVKRLAKLFAANAAFNGVQDMIVENIGLSNQIQSNVPVVINHDNWGGSQIDFSKQADADEFISVTDLDSYLAEHSIDSRNIKYIWLDVEGHEPEVLEGADALYSGNPIPTCMEFNQGIYVKQEKYEKVLTILNRYFKRFIVCVSIGTEDEKVRPISELGMLWEEFEGKTCDLILL